MSTRNTMEFIASVTKIRKFYIKLTNSAVYMKVNGNFNMFIEPMSTRK